MKEYIERENAEKVFSNARKHMKPENYTGQEFFIRDNILLNAEQIVHAIPAADVVEIPATGIGDLSDGYHTFNGLYYQRMILFATLVKQNKGRAWKSYRHEDGELCFGGGWFIVGIDTPEGSYTYHYESKDFDLFDCEELPAGKHWDGHTEADVTRLLSLPAADVVEVRHGNWIHREDFDYVDNKNVKHWHGMCDQCGFIHDFLDCHTGQYNYCPNCGAKMTEDYHEQKE